MIILVISCIFSFFCIKLLFLLCHVFLWLYVLVLKQHILWQLSEKGYITGRSFRLSISENNYTFLLHLIGIGLVQHSNIENAFFHNFEIIAQFSASFLYWCRYIGSHCCSWSYLCHLFFFFFFFFPFEVWGYIFFFGGQKCYSNIPWRGLFLMHCALHF